MKTKKLKLLLSLSSFVFCVAVLCFGVYAATTATLTISGTITFDAYEIYINSVTLNNLSPEGTSGQTTSLTLGDYTGMYIGEEDTQSTINIGTPLVPETESLEIDIELTSLDTTNYQKVTLEYTIPSGSDYEVRSTSTILKPNPNKLTNGAMSSILKIYVSSESTTSLDISSLNLNIGFEDYGTSLLQHDTTNGYYYVEMGTIPHNTSGASYESEYIRWKLVGTQTSAATSTTATQYTRFDGTTAPASDTTGVFVLETNTLLERDDETGYSLNEVAFNHSYLGHGSESSYYHNGDEWEEYDILANDYATSTVRQYINGNNVYKAATYTSGSGNTSSSVPNETSDYSNMYTDFCIDTENDIVYQAIVGRTLSDLYLNNKDDINGGSVTCPDQLTTLNKEGYTSSTVDKFWLLSYYEAYSLFLTNTGTQGPGSSDERKWPTTGSGNVYWLRSPSSSSSCGASGVGIVGSLAYHLSYVYYSSSAARAAFALPIEY